MAERYDPREIEAKWQGRWAEQRAFTVSEDPAREKFYLLEMFPYPSGRIHMGHVRNYSIGDVLARYKGMKGWNVLHPMGWDAFGLPAENAAIEHGAHPARWTEENIRAMRAQLRKLGLSYDWDRELATCDPAYYRWEQWLFIKMYERGLASRRHSLVNWCPRCQTVLANEQVEAGLCWRCESPVTQQELEQWFLRITAYAEELLDYCDKLPGWPERVIVMQRNWIGKSMGAEIRFRLEEGGEPITVFTTRQDTVCGATFMTLAPEHPLALELSRGTPQEEAVAAFVRRVRGQDRLARAGATEKEGIFVGRHCLNPVTGARMPIYVANYVLMEYGTGAVMGVPAHDQRDLEFARRFGLPIIVVVQPEGDPLDGATMLEAYLGPGTLVRSGPFTGLSSTDALSEIVRHLEAHGLGRAAVNYRLRDWGISRQRYWGTPIPMLYCAACGGIVPVPESELPVLLPMDVAISGEGGSPLARAPAFVQATCPRCGGPARRETDTMDTFVDSSWYFLRFTCPDYARGMLDPARSEYWMPVDLYIGGIEHAILHLLYARFLTKVLRDLGLTTVDEPFTTLLTQGMVCKETARCPEHDYLFPEDVTRRATCRRCGRPVEIGRVEKMSKSKRNIVDPDQVIERYGADTARLFILFAAPPEKDLDWSEQGVEGCYRFLQRVWRLVTDALAEVDGVAPWAGPTPPPDDELRAFRRLVHKAIRRVSTDIEERFHFNTAISAIMELVNAAYQLQATARRDEPFRRVLREALETLVLLLSPFAPHLCEELWERLGGRQSLARTRWPAHDEEAAREDEVLVVIQVNGKLRARITVPADIPEERLREAALEAPKIRELTRGRAIRNVVVVPRKLVNIVTG